MLILCMGESNLFIKHLEGKALSNKDCHLAETVQESEIFTIGKIGTYHHTRSH
jgi:hypothetical protein